MRGARPPDRVDVDLLVRLPHDELVVVYCTHFVDDGRRALLGNLAAAAIPNRVARALATAVLVDVDEPVAAAGHEEVVVWKVDQGIHFYPFRCPSVLLDFVEFVLIFWLRLRVHVGGGRKVLGRGKAPTLDRGVERSCEDLLG